ncbi:sulfur carrier protein ThiS [bacterium BMS3Abin11]|nr:sulfur carrier protein ThiS [bacterium BMS3Abin11]GMT41362.1 MAG: thiamine biosynthesis protein ThiS [bacterium]
MSTSINITVNGDNRELSSPSTIVDLTEIMALQGKRFAVEVNGEIVPASQHVSYELSTGDKVEIVGAIGGG